MQVILQCEPGDVGIVGSTNNSPLSLTCMYIGWFGGRSTDNNPESEIDSIVASNGVESSTSGELDASILVFVVPRSTNILHLFRDRSR